MAFGNAGYLFADFRRAAVPACRRGELPVFLLDE